MKNLRLVSKKDQKDFLDSFDHIFCDVDGVLWNLQDPIPGSLEAITSLQKLGKKVIFVSNNTTKTQETYYNQIKSAGYNLDKSDVVQPNLAVIDFLNRNKVSKTVYLIGMTPLRTVLEESGFKVEQLYLENPEESIPKYIQTCILPNDNIGAVLIDIDLNMNVAQIQKAATYLKNPDVLFVMGGSDKRLKFGKGELFIGPGVYHDILEDLSGRQAHRLAKPSKQFGDYINKKYGISDPSKVLFIGDSIAEDMGFGTNCGYQKLLVLSGLTTKENVADWSFPEEYKPKYYVDSLKSVGDILSSL